MPLESHQNELLALLVEADWSQPREQRPEFFYRIGFMHEAEIVHPGLPDGKHFASPIDIDDLAAEDLLRMTRPKLSFVITPKGFEYFRRWRTHAGVPSERTEAAIRGYVDATDFLRRHSAAHDAWSAAEGRLGSAPTSHDLTTIGHLCREALQAFAASLSEARGLSPSSGVTQTVARVRAVLDSLELGQAERPFLDALLVYWGTVVDLVQRQEHGASKEGQVLGFEDARRAVFHTLLVMYELDRAVHRTNNE